jgi:nucleoside-diphosphate-sugar epimerase
MPDRVLLTGATGFVGSHIAQAFAEAGYEVLCGVRASSDLRWLSGLPVERVPLDLKGGAQDLSRTVRNADLVVHAAGITRARRAKDYYSVNAGGTRRLADAALGAGVRRFVLISSLAARGPDDLTKDGRDHPGSAYGRSKLEGEARLRSLGGQMEAVALRPAAVYGPRDTDLLPLFKLARAGWLPIPSGPNLLQPVYATDVAGAALAAAREPVGFGPFPVAEKGRYRCRRRAGEGSGAAGTRRSSARHGLHAGGTGGRIGGETLFGASRLRRAPGEGPGRQHLDVRHLPYRESIGVAGGGSALRGSGAHSPVVWAGGVA